MNLDTARQLLSGMDVERFELRDHAFGDAEVTWMRAGKDIAFGYFGSTSEVHVGNTHFGDKDANFLRQFGTPKFSRNDETGPDDYKDGRTMPGLTLEDVRQELEELEAEFPDWEGYKDSDNDEGSCYTREDHETHE